jgi:hypothetical protein
VAGKSDTNEEKLRGSDEEAGAWVQVLLVEADVVAEGVVGYARGIPESSREIVVWLRWCWSNFAERTEGVESSGKGAMGSGRGIDKVGRVLVKVMDEELADVALENVKIGKSDSRINSLTSSPLDHICYPDAPIGHQGPTPP